jgi:DNA-binding IclR family transcriptional regulator
VANHDVPTNLAVSLDAGKPAHVKSASRALDIIEGLAATPHGLGFSDLARLLGIPKSSLHALLAVLTERGYIALDARRRTYALGIRTWEVGQAYRAHQNLVHHALPVMEGVVAAINETVQLAVLDGIENVYLARVDCSHPVRLQSEVGKRLYAHATGLGKVLLAYCPDPDVRARYHGIPFPSVSTSPIQSFPSLLDALATVRARGFAVDDQEYTPGLRCVAVPIYDLDHCVVAALSVSIPLMRAGDGQLESALRTVAAASTEISRALGAARPDPRLTELTQWHGNVLAPSHRDTDRR